MYKKIYIIIGMCLLLFGCNRDQDTEINQECFTLTQTEVVGYSMTGYFNYGDDIEVMEGYYDCHEVQRGDIVIYQSAAKGQLVKQVRVIPGDSVQIDENRGYLIVNDTPLKNIDEQVYIFTVPELHFMQLYFPDGVMMGEKYFIFGTSLRESFDSRKVAGVEKKDFLGKVKE